MTFSNNRIGNTNLPKLNAQEAFIGILMTVVAADGQISEEEMNDFTSIVMKSKLLKGMSSEQFAVAWNKAIELLEARDIDAFLNMAIAELPEQYYKAIYTIACDLVFADGLVEVNEAESVNDLQKRLGIDDDLAEMTIYVIRNKNSV